MTSFASKAAPRGVWGAKQQAVSQQWSDMSDDKEDSKPTAVSTRSAFTSASSSSVSSRSAAPIMDDDKEEKKPTVMVTIGVPKVIEEKKADDGSVIRVEQITHTNAQGTPIKLVTRTIKKTVKRVKVNKNVAARRKWEKFGDCKGVAPGPEPNVTYVDNQIIRLDLNKKREETNPEDDPLNQLSSKRSIVQCRFCGGTDHFTLRCPKNRGGAASARQAAGSDLPPASDSASGASSGLAKSSAGRYQTPHARGAVSGDGKERRNDEYTLRVSNLSEEASEQDVKDLFGRVQAGVRPRRVFLAKDQQTKKSRGFAFVNYDYKEDAEAAIAKLNGYGYDNLILQVEWAKPREGGAHGVGRIRS